MCLDVIYADRVYSSLKGNFTGTRANIRLSQCRKIDYSALPIYRGLFTPNNSREIPIGRPLVRGMGVFREILVWPTFYLGILCIARGFVLYGTAIYRESRVLSVRWIEILVRSRVKMYLRCTYKHNECTNYQPLDVNNYMFLDKGT